MTFGEFFQNWVLPFVGGSVAGVGSTLLTVRFEVKLLKKELALNRTASTAALEAQAKLFEGELTRLNKHIEKTDTNVDKVRETGHDFAKDAEFAQFAIEQQDKWLEMHRFIGRFEALSTFIQQSLGARLQMPLDVPLEPPRPALPSNRPNAAQSAMTRARRISQTTLRKAEAVVERLEKTSDKPPPSDKP